MGGEGRVMWGEETKGAEVLLRREGIEGKGGILWRNGMRREVLSMGKVGGLLMKDHSNGETTQAGEGD